MDTGAVCIIPEDFRDAYARWKMLLCPCCASEMCDWEWRGEVTEPRAIAEGIMLCGRCIANDHAADPEFVVAMMRAIAAGAHADNARSR
jgi:hypothetical protein